MLDTLIFVVLPYFAIALALFVTPYRYFTNRLNWSAFSTQFLEKRTLYWGSVPWHYGVVLILAGHLIGFLFPSAVQSVLSNVSTLIALESIALALGLLALIGSVILLIRRASGVVKAVTSYSDWILLVLILIQAATGVYMGLFVRWGMQWYLYTAVPWLYSLLTLNPQISYVSGLPLVFKIHVAGAFLILAVLPFTKLVHFLFLPLDFLKDPPLLYRWAVRRDKRVER
jgi:nitrate reductase gamma subunit